jgi:hypothetical protein
MPPNPCNTTFVLETHTMEEDTFWSEIEDAPGEIFDIREDFDFFDDLTSGLNLNSENDF